MDGIIKAIQMIRQQPEDVQVETLVQFIGTLWGLLDEQGRRIAVEQLERIVGEVKG